MFVLKGVYAVPGKNEYATESDRQIAEKFAGMNTYSLYWDDPVQRAAYEKLYGREATERLRTENLAIVHRQKERAVPEAEFVPPDPVEPNPTVVIGAPPPGTEERVLMLTVSRFKEMLKEALKDALREI